jgi:hypothetical protein
LFEPVSTLPCYHYSTIGLRHKFDLLHKCRPKAGNQAANSGLSMLLKLSTHFSTTVLRLIVAGAITVWSGLMRSHIYIVLNNNHLYSFVDLEAFHPLLLQFRLCSLATSFQGMTNKQPLREGYYVLAYRYWDYIIEHPRRKLDNLNKYYENLLANQPEPHSEATDERSRAIRYAKAKYECFYEVRDTKRINEWLEEAEARPQAKYVLHRW